MKHPISAIAIVLLMIAASCTRHNTETLPNHEELKSVYYWKTVFRLDSADMAFINRHDIRRVYLRMFDVTEEPYPEDISTMAVPNASVSIDHPEYMMLRESLTNIEFVPVVYITLDALKAMKGHEGILASNIVTRVRNMCRYNELPNVHELQLDCDWTTSTEAPFFSLCDSVKKYCCPIKLG